VKFDLASNKFYAPLIDTIEAREADEVFLLRSMLFPASHVNHLMLEQSLKAAMPAHSLAHNSDELINLCFTKLLLAQTRVDRPHHILSRWSMSYNLLTVSLVQEMTNEEKPVPAISMRVETPQRQFLAKLKVDAAECRELKCYRDAIQYEGGELAVKVENVIKDLLECDY